jgi:hypothetical protein
METHLLYQLTTVVEMRGVVSNFLGMTRCGQKGVDFEDRS